MGQHYYLVMLLDIYSRKVTGWEVFLAKSAHNSGSVLERAVLAEQMIDQQFVLHADNGSLFKGATLLEKLHHLVMAIHAVDVKNWLCDIDADPTNVHGEFSSLSSWSVMHSPTSVAQ
ncbi:hypothetical protein [Halomonas sp.]|uniref:hypothetical protein n=1 Tax=Halomonas sp. TaxID=1486246 RepID=UPI003850294E